jgi:hypothetical protein
MGYSKLLPLFEKSCQEVLARLSGDTSDEASVFTKEAQALLATVDGWNREAPSDDDRAAVSSRVLDLPAPCWSTWPRPGLSPRQAGYVNYALTDAFQIRQNV